jgi:3-hydroxy-9,10-secoandrosta-1,3,5(10)-triene-9,17-dione monooxygenase reductase component
MAFESSALHGPREVLVAGRIEQDFLGYLVGRTHSMFDRRLKAAREAGIGDDDQLVIAVLALRDGLPAREVAALATQLHGDIRTRLDGLLKKAIVERSRPPDGEMVYHLSETGRGRAVDLIAESKLFESELAERLGVKDVVVLKSLLRRLLAAEAGSDKDERA